MEHVHLWFNSHKVRQDLFALKVTGIRKTKAPIDCMNHKKGISMDNYIKLKNELWLIYNNSKKLKLF